MSFVVQICFGKHLWIGMPFRKGSWCHRVIWLLFIHYQVEKWKQDNVYSLEKKKMFWRIRKQKQTKKCGNFSNISLNNIWVSEYVIVKIRRYFELKLGADIWHNGLRCQSHTYVSCQDAKSEFWLLPRLWKTKLLSGELWFMLPRWKAWIELPAPRSAPAEPQLVKDWRNKPVNGGTVCHFHLHFFFQ